MRNENVLIAGNAGQGKSTNYVQNDLVSKGETPFMLIVDPHESTANALLEQLHGRYGKVRLDDLDRWDGVTVLPLPATGEVDRLQ